MGFLFMYMVRNDIYLENKSIYDKPIMIEYEIHQYADMHIQYIYD